MLRVRTIKPINIMVWFNPYCPKQYAEKIADKLTPRVREAHIIPFTSPLSFSSKVSIARPSVAISNIEVKRMATKKDRPM